MPRRTFFTDFRKFFVRGLAILLPSIVTIGLLVWAIGFLQARIASPINAGVRFVVIRVVDDVYSVFDRDPPSWYTVEEDAVIREARQREGPRPAPLDDEAILSGLTESDRLSIERDVRRAQFKAFWNSHVYLEGMGFVLAIVAIYLAGIFFGNFIGRRVYARLERFFIRLPLVKQVYPNVKQITDFLVGDEETKKAMPGSKVVLVEYPRRGIWTIGLLTGGSMDLVEAAAGCRLTTVFIPSSPTPFTGYTINVPSEEVVEVDITMDEAIRFVVSGGVLVPPHRRPKRFQGSPEEGDPLKRIGPGDVQAGSGAGPGGGSAVP